MALSDAQRRALKAAAGDRNGLVTTLDCNWQTLSSLFFPFKKDSPLFLVGYVVSISPNTGKKIFPRIYCITPAGREALERET